MFGFRSQHLRAFALAVLLPGKLFLQIASGLLLFIQVHVDFAGISFLTITNVCAPVTFYHVTLLCNLHGTHSDVI